MSNAADVASILFHGWLGGRSEYMPDAGEHIADELAGFFGRPLLHSDPDDLWDVGTVAYQLASACSCASAQGGYGCEHETASEELAVNWLDGEVREHISRGRCDQCDTYVWQEDGSDRSTKKQSTKQLRHNWQSIA